MGWLVLAVVLIESRITWEMSMSVWDWSYWYGLWVGKFPTRTNIVDCTVEHQHACVLSLILDSGFNVTGCLKFLSHFLTWETVIRTESQNTPLLLHVASVSFIAVTEKQNKIPYVTLWLLQGNLCRFWLLPCLSPFSSPSLFSLPSFSPENHLGCSSGHVDITYSLLKDGAWDGGSFMNKPKTGPAWLLVSIAQSLIPRNKHISCHSLYLHYN